MTNHSTNGSFRYQNAPPGFTHPTNIPSTGFPTALPPPGFTHPINIPSTGFQTALPPPSSMTTPQVNDHMQQVWHQNPATPSPSITTYQVDAFRNQDWMETPATTTPAPPMRQFSLVATTTPAPPMRPFSLAAQRNPYQKAFSNETQPKFKSNLTATSNARQPPPNHYQNEHYQDLEDSNVSYGATFLPTASLRDHIAEAISLGWRRVTTILQNREKLKRITFVFI
jgi:hypothetical protein